MPMPKTRPYGRMRTGRPGDAADKRAKNAAFRFLGMPEHQSEVRKYKPRASKPKADGELSELQEQIRVITWFDKHCHEYKLPPVALFAIPNGGARATFEAANMKKAGVRAGVEDLFLAAPMRHSEDGEPVWQHGLFIEMKIDSGKIEMEQSAMHHFHLRQGYAAAFAYSHQEAIELIQDYLVPF